MSRKLILGVWMTVCFSATLIPQYVTAQTTPTTPAPVPVSTIASPDRPEVLPPARPTESGIATEPDRRPTPSVPQPESRIRVPHAADTIESSHGSTPAVGVRQSNATAFENRESTTTPPASGLPPRAGKVPTVTRRPAPTLSPREEAAQKLIHERAILRAQQRRVRLELKQGRKPAGNALGWNPESTDPEWVPSTSRTANP